MYLKESTIFINDDLQKRIAKEKSKFTEFMERDEVNYTNARNKLLKLMRINPSSGEKSKQVMPKVNQFKQLNTKIFDMMETRHASPTNFNQKLPPVDFDQETNKGVHLESYDFMLARQASIDANLDDDFPNKRREK